MVATSIQIVPRILVTLVHLIGLIIAIVLLVRKKGTPAILALVAFALLVLVDIGGFLRVGFLDRMIYTGNLSSSGTMWAVGSLNCFCSLFDIIALVCLIIAIWQAVSGKGVSSAEVEDIDASE